MKKEVGWLKTAARDIIGLGSIPFFILVLARVYMINNSKYFAQFAISGIIFILAYIFIRQNIYTGLGLIVLVFTTLFYKDLNFTMFGMGAYVLLVSGTFYLKQDLKKIFLGIIIGGISIGLTYLF